MAPSSKIKKGIMIGSCALMLYGMNYLHHYIKSSTYNLEIEIEKISFDSQNMDLILYKTYKESYKKLWGRYEENLGLAKRKLALYERNKEKCRKMQEVFKDIDSGQFPLQSFAGGMIKYYDKQIDEMSRDIGYCNKGIKIILDEIKRYDREIENANEKIKDTEKEIEELTQKREVHLKRRFNPFYKVFR